MPPGTGFPLRRLLRLASFNSQSYGGGILILCTYFIQEQDGPVQIQSHVTTDGESIIMSRCLVHSALKGSIQMVFNPTSGLVHLAKHFYVTIGRAA
jgi:hypothetical protein